MQRISRPADSRFPYLPGIDAMRAIAVLAVFLYHADVAWMPGGFLGVDVFFVISGYLITSLLLRERRARGHVRVGRFWLRRARRLLPAAGVMIAVTMVAAAVLEPERVRELRGDALAALAYVANWHFVLAEHSYFEQFQRPSLFTHLWSLSVEEQFYLLWPLVFAAGMQLFGRTRLLLGVLAGAAASVALAWLLFEPGADASRLYYGTDTHAVGLLAGVALALAWSPVELRRHRSGPLVGPILDAVGTVALAYVVLCFLRVHDYDAGLWHGGYAALAAATAALIAVLAHPAPRLGRLLGRGPLVWLGLRSYSFYLWHWPVVALSGPAAGVELPSGVLVPLQFLAVLALAGLSYRFVEQPFRRRRPALPPRLRPALAVGVVGVVLAIGWGLVGSESERLRAAEASTPAGATVRPQQGGAKAARGSGGAGARAGAVGGRPRQVVDYPRVIALGDSVMIGARERLAEGLGPRFSMSAEVGRQADEFVAIVKRLRREGHRPEALVIHMGNNGPLYGETMAAIQRATADVGELFLVNDHAPVSWEGQSNKAIAEAARDWPHTTLIDWNSVARSRPGLLWDDIHLTRAGARAYARLITAAVREKVPFPPPPAIAPAVPVG